MFLLVPARLTTLLPPKLLLRYPSHLIGHPPGHLLIQRRRDDAVEVRFADVFGDGVADVEQLEGEEEAV